MSLQIQSVTKRYKGDVVLDDVTLHVSSGETLVLFGPSGAGKSVLLRLIAGVIDPDSGNLSVDGRDMAGVDPEERGIGMAFQNFALFPHMTAHQNIASSLEVSEPSRSKLDAAVKAVASLLKIEHVLGHAPRALSNGQKQRTALARALVGSPSLLLLDDPLRNVDAKLRFEMRLELPALIEKQGATVVYVTQDYKEAMALGDQIAVMVGGKILQVGSPENVYLQPATIDIARQFGDPVINLFDVTVENDDKGKFVELSGVRLALPEQMVNSREGSAAGPDANPVQSIPDQCVLGLRAEALKFVDSDDPAAIPVNIEAVTPLNEKIVTLATTSGKREILVSRPATSEGPLEGKAWLSIDPSALHFFDKANGQRLFNDVAHTSASASSPAVTSAG